MCRVADICPGGVTLRLRPFIIGMSNTNNQHLDLIELASGHGATALSTEFFCLEDRAHASATTPRYDAIMRKMVKKFVWQKDSRLKIKSNDWAQLRNG